MQIRNLWTGIFFTLAVLCFIVGSMMNLTKIAAINKRRPENRQISFWGSYLGKQLRISREYRQLYPTGKLELMERIVTGIGLVFFLIAAKLFGFVI
jgi:hypothetical protein